MPTNDFLAFATGGSANVLSQAAYAALSDVTNGYSSGLAISQRLNKTWRQSSVISHIIAQFICDETGQNALDNGDLTTLLTNFKNAITAATAAAAAGVTLPVTTAQTVDSTKNATRYIVKAASGVAFTVALSSTLSTGFTVTIDTVLGSASVTINGADFVNGAGSPGGTVYIPKGREARITTDGAGNVYVSLVASIASANSAATVDLGAQTSQVITITGTTDVTSFGSSATPGVTYTIIAGGSFNLVNGAALVVPGGTVKTTVNDVFTVLCTTAGNYLVTGYSFFNGQRQTVPGQCRLTLSGSNLLLSPYNGNKMMVNSQLVIIPDAGVTLAPTGLSASTVYYIYAYLSGSTLTLEASTTGSALQLGTGVMVKSTDATRTLVGMAATTGTTTWVDSLTQRLVLSWFNRSVKRCDARLSTNVTPAANANPVSTDLSFSFLTWANTDVLVGFMAEIGGVTSGIIGYTYLYLDGTIVAIASSNIVSGGQTADCNVNQRSYGGSAALSEGLHSVTIGNGPTAPTYYAATYGTSMSYAEIQG